MVRVMVWFVVPVMAGFSSSVTTTEKLAVLVLLSLSVAVQLTVVVPMGNWLLEAGVQLGVMVAPNAAAIALSLVVWLLSGSVAVTV